MRFTRREKQVVASAMVCIGLLLAFQVFVRPAISRAKTLKRVVSEKREMLADLQIKSKEYDSLKQQLEQIRIRIESQHEDTKILSSIERMQRDCGLTKNVVNMTPTTIAISDVYEKTNVEIKYSEVTLNQIIQFLLKIESSDLLIGVKSLEIKQGLRDSTLLDVVVQLLSISNV